ncbi:MAG: hypothetical protein JWN08_3478 [Frankiales bacterium]|jgi:hypothetical protein|nr:hypothetical protein [Frankiales bacterium]
MDPSTVTIPAWTHARPVDLPTLRRRTGDLLRAGVPLTLLVDLVDPHGPDSRALFGVEGGDTGWLQAC